MKNIYKRIMRMKAISNYHIGKFVMPIVKYILTTSTVITMVMSCKEFVEIDPPDSELTEETVFNNDETAIATMTAIYHQLQNEGFASGNRVSITVLGGISADILKEYSLSVTRVEFYQNELIPTNSFNQEIWNSLYNTIYNTNSILEGITNSIDISPNIKTQIEGEAKFIRAFCYFYLTNLYGEVPLLTTTDYRVNAVASRNSGTEVYQQIVSDLKDSEELLHEDYVVSNGERTRPNKGAAKALLSRVYLYMEDWINAEIYASEVIKMGLYNLVNLDAIFLANNEEAIWQLLPVHPNYNTWEGFYFILENDPTTPSTQFSMALTNELVEEFETEDLRGKQWVGDFYSGSEVYHYPFKYKIKAEELLIEYSTVLRLGEQYLIRAEARAQQGKLIEAQQDINRVRKRAGLDVTVANTQEQLLEKILQERKIELFAEWGHRWLDLKRTGNADMVMENLKPNWQHTDVLYPIPEQEILNNPNLTQNDGY